MKVVLGLGGSGKSTFVRKRYPKLRVVSADTHWFGPGWKRRTNAEAGAAIRATIAAQPDDDYVLEGVPDAVLTAVVVDLLIDKQVDDVHVMDVGSRRGMVASLISRSCKRYAKEAPPHESGNAETHFSRADMVLEQLAAYDGNRARLDTIAQMMSPERLHVHRRDHITDMVEAAYDARADRYAAEWCTPLEVAWHTERLAKVIPAGAQVLDIGCGDGQKLATVTHGGKNLTGIDVSIEQLLRAAKCIPFATLRHTDVRTVNFRAGLFDVALALWSLVHIPRVEHAEVFARVHRWLKPGGTFVLAQPDKEETCCVTDAFLGVECHWSYHTPEKTCLLLRRAGFDITKVDRYADTTGQPSVWIHARKKPEE